MGIDIRKTSATAKQFVFAVKSRGQVGQQIGWLLGARVISAGLQFLIIAVLARTTRISDFAGLMIIYSVVQVGSTLNGFGRRRQMQYLRAAEPEDPRIRALYSAQLSLIYASGVLFLLVALVGIIIGGGALYGCLTVGSVWFTVEQVVSLRNALAIVDGRSINVFTSYVLRKVVPVLFLLSAWVLSIDGMLPWVTGMAGGSVVALFARSRGEEEWMRSLKPATFREVAATKADLSFWWSQVGSQIREFDISIAAWFDSIATALYALPSRLLRPVTLISQAACSVAFPYLVRRKTLTVRTISMWSLVIVSPTAVCAALAWIAAPFVPLFVGNDYVGSVPVLRTLAIATVATSVMAALTVLLQSRSSRAPNRAAGIINSVWGFGQLLVMPLGTISDGAAGAALATASWSVIMAGVSTGVGLRILASRRS